jgi:hypothetical protein
VVFTVHAYRDDGKRFIVRAVEKLTVHPKPQSLGSPEAVLL